MWQTWASSNDWSPPRVILCHLCELAFAQLFAHCYLIHTHLLTLLISSLSCSVSSVHLYSRAPSTWFERQPEDIIELMVKLAREGFTSNRIAVQVHDTQGFLGSV